LDVRISQVSVATYCRWGRNLCGMYIENSLTNQRILKIGPNLSQLLSNIKGLLFWDTVYTVYYYIAVDRYHETNTFTYLMKSSAILSTFYFTYHNVRPIISSTFCPLFFIPLWYDINRKKTASKHRRKLFFFNFRTEKEKI